MQEEKISPEEDKKRMQDKYKKHYREVRYLAEGGMGSVFLVERRADLKKFASKKQIRTNQAEYKIAQSEL